MIGRIANELANSNTKIKQALKNKEYVKAAVEYILQYDGVTFVELERLFQPYMVVAGTQEIGFDFDPNIVLWGGVSDEFCAIIQELVSIANDTNNTIMLASSPVWFYMVDGKAPDLPIAKKIPKNGYKTRRWLPVCFARNNNTA